MPMVWLAELCGRAPEASASQNLTLPPAQCVTAIRVVKFKEKLRLRVVLIPMSMVNLQEVTTLMLCVCLQTEILGVGQEPGQKKRNGTKKTSGQNGIKVNETKFWAEIKIKPGTEQKRVLL